MNVPKFRVALIGVILSTILSLISVAAMQPYYVIIPSSGLLRTAPPASAHKSEIRAVFVHAGSFSPYPDWDLVAQTCADQGVNTIIVTANPYLQERKGCDLDSAIDAVHQRSMDFHILHTGLFAIGTNDAYASVRADGSTHTFGCPTKTATRDLLQSHAEELASHDIDGFIFDYYRYALSDHCYCSECKAKFEEWLGETIPDSNWPPTAGGGGDFAPEGSRYNEFLEWRIIPITELVRDMRNWMLAINPDLKFGAAVWTYLPSNNPASRRKSLGQDWNDWIRQGYIDWVSPMLYPNNPEGHIEMMEAFQEYAVGAEEGKVEVAPFLTNQYPDVISPEDFKAQVDTIRAHGADGWCIWRYGGPGDTGPEKPDIRDYLSIIDMPQTFSLYNISCAPGGTNTTITWTTDIQSTSKVEYSTSLLFNATKKYYAPQDFDYWDIDYIEGTIVEVRTNVTEHSITLIDLEPGMLYYYRVQSEDQSGVATSQVHTFEL